VTTPTTVPAGAGQTCPVHFIPAVYVCMYVYIPMGDATINREGKGRPLMWDSDTTTVSVSRLKRA
jgi:hypothetical protein